MIRILIAEDETLVRSGVRTLLERQEGMTVVAEATDGEEALDRLRYGIDVGLLDVRMPRRGGIEVLEGMREWPSPPACLLLTTFDDREALLAGVRAGARGYLRKDVTIQTLARAVHVLAQGGTFFQPSLAVASIAAWIASRQAPWNFGSHRPLGRGCELVMVHARPNFLIVGKSSGLSRSMPTRPIRFPAAQRSSSGTLG